VAHQHQEIAMQDEEKSAVSCQEQEKDVPARREFLTAGGLLVSALAVAGSAPLSVLAQSKKSEGKEEQEEKVTPTEDLMREHGVLRRILLIYEECARRLQGHEDLDPHLLATSAGIVRHFVEDYHEKQEEDYLFPRFRRAGKDVDLVKVLLEQHRAGRRVTAQIRRFATPAGFRSAGDRRALVHAIQQFTHMYRPHAAREDTVLFPDLHKIVSPHEFDALGEEFERNERRTFGEDGFEKYVSQVGHIEKQLGIYDLTQFTPKTA
jgi:hemerythrin-like domain-containing protein